MMLNNRVTTTRIPYSRQCSVIDPDPVGSEIFSRIRIQNVKNIFMEDPRQDPELYKKTDLDPKKIIPDPQHGI
jgi:hypothetical protein